MTSHWNVRPAMRSRISGNVSFAARSGVVGTMQSTHSAISRRAGTALQWIWRANASGTMLETDMCTASSRMEQQARSLWSCPDPEGQRLQKVPPVSFLVKGKKSQDVVEAVDKLSKGLMEFGGAGFIAIG